MVKRCERCNKWMHSDDSSLCAPCWEDLGQMSFWQDEDEDPRISAAEEQRIDTIFDRDLNRDMNR